SEQIECNEMTEPLQRTKVVICHLPLSLSQNDLLALFHDHFNDGAQFKAIVEYVPSQRVPKPCSRKGSLEGTIFKELINSGTATEINAQ
ncbi:hypothetical protein CUMW_261110, partial [Citrus unshiu]